jgi:hypothetical protein
VQDSHELILLKEDFLVNRTILCDINNIVPAVASLLHY